VTAAERGLEVIAALGCELGEGPVWDDRDGRLAWVDILTGRLLRTDPRTGATVAVKVGGSIGAVALRRSGGFVAAVDRAIWIVEDGPPRRIATLEPDDPRYRWNDGKADPWGRFLVATMQWAPREPVGTLWRLEADGRLEPAMDGLTIGNGLAWSPDGRALYYVDSALGTVDALDYDPATGMAGAGRVGPPCPAPRGRALQVSSRDPRPAGRSVRWLRRDRRWLLASWSSLGRRPASVARSRRPSSTRATTWSSTVARQNGGRPWWPISCGTAREARCGSTWPTSRTRPRATG
jgi:hypothetical protein